MMNQQHDALLREQLAACLGEAYANSQFSRSGTGCINETWSATGAGLTPLFIKLGTPDRLAMYQAEQQGLAALRAAEALRVPHCHAVLANEHFAALVLEFIELQPLDETSAAPFGEALASLHAASARQCGFEQDNFIGRSVQHNGWVDNWWTFFCQQRMAPQIERAEQTGMRPALVTRLRELVKRIPDNFAEHQPPVSLLHGDLWSGNVAADRQGNPVLYDPAVYYGDAETDLAMMQMFGGLPAAVFDAYHALRPRQPGQADRQPLYDAYHWLNHFNLFGVIYLGQLERCVDAVSDCLR